jgi:amino-acid N-acetyltransferase
MRTRKAILPDATHIHDLISGYSGDGTLLPRTLGGDLRERQRLCGARTRWPHHRLRRAASVWHAPGRSSLHHRGPWAQGKGGGGRLMKALMAEAKKHRVGCICLFTRSPQFFARQGFAVAQREDLPDKIYKDCHVCPRFHSNAMKSRWCAAKLPKFAILPEPPNWLIKIQALQQ